MLRLVTCGWTAFLLASSHALRAEGKMEWSATVYMDGRHNAFTDLIHWRGWYYLCFRHGKSHLSMDGEIRLMRSRDFAVWENAGIVDTLGDDRDPHFVATEQSLHLYFGTWDMAHAADTSVPVRGRLRTYHSASSDGKTWSDVQACADPDWWLWRVREHEGWLYSVAYYINWPVTKQGEARLVRSRDGLNWSTVSTITKDRVPDEADLRFRADRSIEVVMRTCDAVGETVWSRSDPSLQRWETHSLGLPLHSPVMTTWRGRCFVAGRAVEGKEWSTRIWELEGNKLNLVLTLPSGGDTAYPGLIVDPESAADRPVLLVSWYSQHERRPEQPDAASIYIARVSVGP